MVDKFMLFMFGSGSLGGVIAQVTSDAPGKASMQYLMLSAIGALGLTIVYLHKQNTRDRKNDKEDHDKTVGGLIERLDKKESAMSIERITRIDMLMKRISDDTEAKKDVALANKDVAHALENNTDAINELKTFMHKDLKEFIKELIQGVRHA